MRHSPTTLMLTAALAATVLSGAPALAFEPGGLSKQARTGLRSPETKVPETDLTQLYGSPGAYSGVRELPRLGLTSPETYSGMFQPLSKHWGSSLETGYSRDLPGALPRYSLAGQLHTAVSPRHGFSLGLKFTTTDRSSQQDVMFSSAMDAPGLHDPYTLERQTGSSSYELSFSYLYGTRHSFGMSYQLGQAGPFAAPYGLTPGSRTFALTSQHWLSPSWALSYDISAPEPGALLQSPNFGVGLRYRF